jgi:hypothetical protein
MIAIKTTAVLEDARHLRLIEPLSDAVGTVFQVIVMVPSSPHAPTSGNPFEAALGSYYHDYPNEPQRTTDELMAELREGEQD